MKKIAFIITTALAAFGMSAVPALADSQPNGAVSVQLGSNDINGARVSQLGVSSQVMFGDGYLGTASVAVGNNHGDNARSIAVSVGRVYSLSQDLAIAPTVELGYDKAGSYGSAASPLGVYSAKHLAVGVDAIDRLGDGFSVNGGVRVGRSFGSPSGYDSGTYAGADIGVAYHVGAGQVGISYGFKSMPLVASSNLNERGINVGYTAYF